MGYLAVASSTTIGALIPPIFRNYEGRYGSEMPVSCSASGAEPLVTTQLWVR